MTSLVIFLRHLEGHLLSISDKAGWLHVLCEPPFCTFFVLTRLGNCHLGADPGGWLERLAEWSSFPFLELEGGILTKKLGKGLQHRQTELWWGRPLPARHSLSPWNPCSPWSVLCPCGSALQGVRSSRPLLADVTGRGLAMCGWPLLPRRCRFWGTTPQNTSLFPRRRAWDSFQCLVIVKL